MKILPSIMCADQLRLGDAIRELERGAADAIHVDVMDGYFVPGFTFGVDAVKAITNFTTLPLDIHVMSRDPFRHALDFASLPVECVTVHVEADIDPIRLLETIKLRGCKAGLALNPGTPISGLEHLLSFADRILVMTVSPGFVGQSLLEHSLRKAEALVTARRNAGLAFEVYVDGGVKIHNVAAIAATGADGAISGSGIFGGERTICAALEAFRSTLSASHPQAGQVARRAAQ